MSTVNGRTIADVLKQIREKKTPNKDKLGKPYFSIAEYFNVFDNAVGVANYNVDYSDYTYTNTLSGQELYSVKCRITIIDDDGKPVLYRECYGGYTTQAEHNTGKDVNLQNSAEFVCNTAFKNAAKKFGIFGRYEEGDSSSNANTNKPAQDKPTQNTQKSQQTSKNTVKLFATVGAFNRLRDDEQSGRPVYGLSAQEYVGEQPEEGLSNIIFYPNQYKDETDGLNAYLGQCADGKRIKLRIKVSSLAPKNGVKQYVFKGFQKSA